MIRKKSNTKQANKRKPVAKEKVATGDKKNDNKAVKVAVEESFLIRWRFHLLLFFVFCAFALLVARVAYIQIIEPDNLIKQGDLRSVRVKSIPSARGIISDRNGEPLAVSVPVEAVWADPATIFKENALSQTKSWHALADVLGIDRQGLIDKIKRNEKRRFIYLQRQVSPAMANYIRELKLPGVGLKSESRRYYPAGEVSAHLVGVTGIDGHGLEGVERSYDEWLTGAAGKKTIRKDRYGRVVENIAWQDKQEGKSLQLTIDQRLQAIAYRAIKQAVADHRATSGSVVMLDVKTGAVLAMVNAPSYNPNNRSDWQSYQMRNRVITDSMEPGSTIKPFVILAALENGIADKDTIVDTGNGVLRLGGSRVRDVSRVGKASLTTILKKSSNIGVTKLAMQMPVEALLGLYSSVGFGELSGLNLVGEVTGIFPTRTRWSPIERATIAFGYGLSITPIQLAHAYATLGNLGKYEPIHIIESNDHDMSRQVVSAKYARQVLDMLETVTQKGGSARRAAVPGYRVGAKTGTSRKASAGGYSDEYITYTAGLAPVSDPRIALVVIVNEPQGDDYYGGSVASPVFSEIMKGALQILNVAPDENKFQQ
ncbi:MULTISPECIES: penicillin-binding transpeptidase domain-containing protein [Vibrio]|uniref:penicillin-binding transpeptidase domain-containing protein n=1 Tax=Vibrio TaxID=662 RepID=UPI001A8DF36F|nr:MULTISPECIES: penicillin-binding transpeptidase domain-containing protein [Vibrio]MBO0243677.1 peptidoglycan glycosyltransferase FtsI [Vibrio sp. Vb0592]MCR9636471.1 penicillin-binding transpeptidase domain-containing protein [Vibrio alginolyticus]MDW1735084.1 penicillin-binding transpeptidase domain-containing protein [Vibrio sp. Vb2235]MDW1787356.1 penicillin-binding transpeptidase domain-containing protein [Vibrio sp. Vb2227]MDW1816989.1 penicillin-binding transpeptidase domain-containin